MIVEQTFCGELLARALPGGEDVAILAIRAPGAAPLRLPKTNYVAFQIELPDIASTQELHEAHVRKALRWLRNMNSAQRRVRLMIVCEAGRSRSAAFAEFVSEWLGLPHKGDTSEANQALLAYLRNQLPES
ncbi:MAG: hypothetical protein CVV05_00515 [Gammaproteobacteria bacterium HGW-Gammaproteobacteria-1]|jgi:predicted protein tyrosine phosphatase|nr:MAG: hypothetical protein CVV05_00515 [Gammaproteobacteria bacterium HGW-Gammaproteobacteria-1]